MTERYDPAAIESKWQAYWDEHQTFRTPDKPGPDSIYLLDMFPYPSGSGLHVGHPEGYTATDILARYHRANGKSVLHPMGWDAFGLPAEQHAIKTGTHPAVTTAKNIETFKRQLKMLGFSYDWTREINTTDPGYVKWTQWIFLQLFKRGLAYQDEKSVNWCAELGTVLANEEVIGGLSERGQHPVERLPLRQWMLKITAYSDRLLDGLKDVEWPNSTRTMQSEWIGRSEGAHVSFKVGDEAPIEVFTTRPDTLFGATFMVLAPEHPLVSRITTPAQKETVDSYVAVAKNKSDLARKQNKKKTGVFTGAHAINPVNGAEVPIWIADYVLMDYGTGAIMAVPGHDERDFEFAKEFNIPILRVVAKDKEDADAPLTEAFCDTGISVNSGDFSNLSTKECKAKVTEFLTSNGSGKKHTEYKLRDWVFSRQRYWGEPFPIYFPVACEGDPRAEGATYTIDYQTPIPVPESELPVTLPELDNYQPGDDPAGVLARATDWRFFQKDGKWFARETNNMPQWAGSCWYYLRYLDPNNATALFDESQAGWLPVDLYVGGAEHAVLHLLYARFWHMVLYDAGIVKVKEPFSKLVHQGMILGQVQYVSEDGARYEADDVEKNKGGEFVLKSDHSVSLKAHAAKMSKSIGNVVNPDDIVRDFGADALRVYEMFMGPLEATKPWNTASISGVSRFLERCYALATSVSGDGEMTAELERLLHKSIKKVTEDIEGLRFNTAISAMNVLSRELLNASKKSGSPWREGVSVLAVLLHPFAPHLGEEMWEILGHKESVQLEGWPSFDAALCVDASVNIPIQINGKKRGVVVLPKGIDEAAAFAAAEGEPKIKQALAEGKLVKTIWVQDRILNLIIR